MEYISFYRADGSQQSMRRNGDGVRRTTVHRQRRFINLSDPDPSAFAHGQRGVFDPSGYYTDDEHGAQRPPGPLPRNVVRRFRKDNDEPADGILFIYDSRKSICLDGRDRSRCSACRKPIPNKTAGGREVRPLMSPQRVLRDLIMSDAAEPMPPALREALLRAFVSARAAEDKSFLEPTFTCFPLLPPEIGRMIWEEALPTRVLLREDLDRSSYRGITRTRRPASHIHAFEELWQSDLFHVCRESRRVVQALGGGAATAAAGAAAAEPTVPLYRHVTTRARLHRGLDVLYYPWHGTKAAQFRGGDGPVQRTMLDSVPGLAASSSSTATTTTTLTYPVYAMPYGHWASQLRTWQVPATKVAFDIAWLDRQHPDTLAWAVGVDLSEPPGGGSASAGGAAAGGELCSIKPRPVAPESLHVVLADIIVPVRIKIDREKTQTLTQAELQLLQHHNYGQPETSTTTSSTTTMIIPNTSKAPVNLKGKDFAVLVGLYDDARIDELLALMDGDDCGEAATSGLDRQPVVVVNKAALHHCIGCTRRAWEARSSTESPRSWSRLFGTLVGGRLKASCRPMILVSVVLDMEVV